MCKWAILPIGNANSLHLYFISLIHLEGLGTNPIFYHAFKDSMSSIYLLIRRAQKLLAEWAWNMTHSRPLFGNLPSQDENLPPSEAWLKKWPAVVLVSLVTTPNTAFNTAPEPFPKPSGNPLTRELACGGVSVIAQKHFIEGNFPSHPRAAHLTVTPESHDLWMVWWNEALLFGDWKGGLVQRSSLGWSPRQELDFSSLRVPAVCAKAIFMFRIYYCSSGHWLHFCLSYYHPPHAMNKNPISKK